MQFPPRFPSLLLAVPLALLAACDDDATPGTRGHVEFVADDCGEDVCSLGNFLAVDGTIDVSLRPVGDISIDGLRIVTASDAIAEVVPDYADDDGVPSATVRGNAPGRVELLAIDGSGAVVDSITVEYLAVRRIDVEVVGARLEGPNAILEYDDQYFVGTGSDVEVVAIVRGDISGPEPLSIPLVGKMTYLVEVDSELARTFEPGDSVRDGRFRFAAPVGNHVIAISTAGQKRSLVFDGQ